MLVTTMARRHREQFDLMEQVNTNSRIQNLDEIPFEIGACANRSL